jgi:dCTP deaminase
VYSRIDILRVIKNGELKIEPFSAKSTKPNAVVFHLDSEIAVAKRGNVDPLTCGDFSKFYEKKKVRGRFLLKPKEFILARTLERVGLSDRLAMLVEGRSTLARLGVSVTQTAMVIEAGHGTPRPRKIVLEICNSGPLGVYLTPHMPIAKGTVFPLDTPADVLYDSYGKYGRRKDPDELLPIKG